MNVSVVPTTLDRIRTWRDMYRADMNCQVVHDSIHDRPGWTQEYLLSIGDAPVGYGSVAVGGPWTEQPALYEVYVVPARRLRLLDLCRRLLEVTRVGMLEVQSNDALATVMLHAFVTHATSEAILFEDKQETSSFHYNRPYGDIYMEVEERFRQRGLGAFIVQELKRVCYENGHVPAARCNRDTIASQRTLQRAGFVPCGHMLKGAVRVA